MGYNNYVYIGAYLEVKKGEREVKKTTYSHHKTGVPVKTKFDPDTGTSNIKEVKTIIVDYRPSVYDIEDVDEDAMVNPPFCASRKDYVTFIPTELGSYSIGKVDSADVETIIDLESIDVNTCKSNFKEKYGHIIEGFKKQSDDVQVRFGVVTHSY